MKVINISEPEYSPKELLDDLMSQIDETETLIVLNLKKNGDLLVDHTDETYVKILGLLDVAKQDVMDKIRT